MARAAILSAVVLGTFVAACSAKTDTAVTSRVYFDIDIGGKAAGTLLAVFMLECLQPAQRVLDASSSSYNFLLRPLTDHLDLLQGGS